MTTNTKTKATNPDRVTASDRRRQPTTGVGRLVRRLERERRTWARRPTYDGPVVATEVAWRAGVAEGLRLAQLAIRKGV
jgi:hypothetical protein